MTGATPSARTREPRIHSTTPSNGTAARASLQLSHLDAVAGIEVPEGATRIAAVLRELETRGYLRRTRERTPNGRVVTRTVSCNQTGHHEKASVGPLMLKVAGRRTPLVSGDLPEPQSLGEQVMDERVMHSGAFGELPGRLVVLVGRRVCGLPLGFVLRHRGGKAAQTEGSQVGRAGPSPAAAAYCGWSRCPGARRGRRRPAGVAAITHARQSGLVKLPANGPAVEILADAGYQGLGAQTGGRVVTPPHRKFKKNPPDWYEEMHERQRKAHSSRRIRVEHGITHLKNWRALARHHGRREYMSDTIQAVAGLLSHQQTVSLPAGPRM
ncbi:transposase family protein [Streptomyces sp. NBC_00820]|uniref:transposase family protein n=1 Tax=Streptomyces sp. NBC_00820 TaxID=2975842 RepID=UPI002ED51E21|nr:transposase family protein [Streptomyces sp. NBC_00820]